MLWHNQCSALDGLESHQLRKCTSVFSLLDPLYFSYISLWLGQRAIHRSHPHFPTHQTGRGAEIRASDHAATVARQHDYVHSLLLGNQHFPSYIDSHSSSLSALNCCLIAFKGRSWISRKLVHIHDHPQPSIVYWWSGGPYRKTVPFNQKVSLWMLCTWELHKSTEFRDMIESWGKCLNQQAWTFAGGRWYYLPQTCDKSLDTIISQESVIWQTRMK